MKKIICLFLCVLLLCGTVMSSVSSLENGEELTVLFTHDIHDYLYPTTTYDNSQTVEHGGAARLKTLIKENSNENTLYLDAGDFSMGTLYQAAYSTDAYELRNLGLTGCAVTTFGNHEFDYGAEGTAKMLRAAKNSGDTLPQIVQSNIDFSGDLSEEQRELKAAMDEYGVKEYTVLESGGKKVGVFGLVGLDCIECIQTDLKYTDYIKAAQGTVKKLQDEGCDVIIALSHSGTEGDGKNGEDIELAKQVNGINLIISAHSHSLYKTPVKVNNTAIVSCGEYLKYLGKLTISANGKDVSVGNYSLIPINSFVKEDEETAARMQLYKNRINETYLKDEGISFDDVICHSSYNLISLNEMYATHQEYTVGNIIADSYMYEARRNGIDDIDVALVGLGTVRSSIKIGDIKAADVFEICSLGVGADGSAGHPIVAAYVTGKELKLLTELDASLGTIVSSIKMSYSGLSYAFNTKRVVLDRVTRVNLVNEYGGVSDIEDEKLYKVAANMYAVNMLGMLNGLTKGMLSITPKDKNGKPIEDFYKNSLKNTEGKEIKEWVALKNYLSSFDKNKNGVPELPAYYQKQLGRKVKVTKGGTAILKNPGAATSIIPFVAGCLIGLIIVTVLIIVFAKKFKKPKIKKDEKK